MENKISKFEKLYSAIVQNEEDFLIELLFELTISFRVLNEEKGSIRNLSQINEINHRILNRLRDLKSGENWSSKNYLVDNINRHVKSAPDISGYIGAAISRAYDKVYA